MKPLIRTDQSELIDVLHTNLLGTTMACRSVLKIMTRHRSTPRDTAGQADFSTREYHQYFVGDGI
jgi:hypothetical protein